MKHGPAIPGRPIVLDARRDPQVCVHCQARPFSICSVIDDNDLERLGAAAVSMSVQDNPAMDRGRGENAHSGWPMASSRWPWPAPQG